MRIISQDGMYDFPYNNIRLSIDCSSDKEMFFIFFKPVNYDGISKAIAAYSSEAKAKKAMEMMHKEYMKHIYGQGGAMATADFYVPPFAFIPPKIFRFPKDEDLEV